MKTEKEELKEIIKECLIEILTESFSKRQSKKERSSIKESDMSNARESEERRLQEYRKSLETKPQNKLPESISRAFSGNSIMSDILKDTAETTLKEQIRAEKTGVAAVDKASKVVAESDDITRLFGKSANQWEHLAFTSKK
jgi:hypothetical protein